MTYASLTLEKMIHPRLIFLDDNPRSVKEHVAVARKCQYETVVVSTDKELVRLLNERRPNDRIYADMHMPNILDFRAVGLPTVSTEQGAAVAISVFRGLLPALRMEYVPTRVLTIYPLDASYKEYIEDAKDEGMDVDYIEKSNIEKFREDIIIHKNEYKNSYMKRFITANKIVEEWCTGGEDAKKIPSIFGYRDLGVSEWVEVAQENIRHIQNDISKRAEAIIFIKVGLIRAFGEDSSLENERGWLREADDLILQGKTPWDCLTSGELECLMKVVGIIGKIT